MSDTFAGVRLTEAVVAALRLASARRIQGDTLSTFNILLALESCDVAGAWSRFLIDERLKHDPTPISNDTWEGVPLTGEAAAALTRARQIAEAYDLTPLPPGALALAIVWDPESAAARAFVGTSHMQLIIDIQDDVLGTQLHGIEHIDDQRPRGLDDRPGISDLEAMQSLSEVTPLLPVWLLRLLLVGAAVGVWFSLTTAPSWQFTAEDDLQPPISRPALADAIPPTPSMNSLLGLDLVRNHDGLPRSRVFDSVMPSAWDLRHEVIDSAWAGHWESTAGNAEVEVQLASTVVDYDKTSIVTRFVDDCVPSGNQESPNVVNRSGYVKRTDESAYYCSIFRVGQTQIFVGVATFDTDLIVALPTRVSRVESAIAHALPVQTAHLKTTFSTPYASAQIRRTWLSVIVLIPIVWLLPTLLMDRAFWQRLRWSLLMRRFTSVPHPGLDIDPVVRARLWSSALVACLQALAAIWVLRGLWSSDRWWDLVRGVADRVGWIVAGPMDLALALVAALTVGMAPRLLHRRRTRGPKAFAGHRRLLWVGGIALSFATLAAAYWVMSVGVAMSALGTDAAPDFVQQRLSAVFRVASIPMVLAALVPMGMMRRLAMRALRTRESHDDRPPILLLRSFVDDGIKVRARGNQRRSLIDRLSLRRWERFEEVIAAALTVQGPVEGVGQVGERLPPALGAVRRQFTNEEWQDRVHDLMAQASLICITLGRTESLAWEIRRIADSGYLWKTVFVLPPTKRAEHIRRLAVLADVLQLNWVDLDVSPSGGWALAIHITAKGATPEIIRARAQEDVAYDVALEMMRLRVLGWSWDTNSLADQFQVRAPRAQIYPRGHAPKTKSWWRRPWLLLTIINVTGLVSLPFVFLAGEDANTSAMLDLGTSTAWDVAADLTTGDMYAIVDGAGIYRLSVTGEDDNPELSAHRVAKIDTSEFLLAADGWLVTTNHVKGTMQGISPGSASATWKRDDLPGVRSVVAHGDRLYVALPSQRKVLSINRATGKDVAEVPIGGIPWSLTILEHAVGVAIADRNEVMTLGLDDLEPIKTLTTDAPSTTIMAADGDLWVYYPSEHALEAVAGPSTEQRIATRSESPALASNGMVMAIGGVEMISTLRPTGELHRNRYLLRHPSKMSVTKTGDVLAATDHQLVFVKTSTN